LLVIKKHDAEILAPLQSGMIESTVGINGFLCRLDCEIGQDFLTKDGSFGSEMTCLTVSQTMRIHLFGMEVAKRIFVALGLLPPLGIALQAAPVLDLQRACPESQ
jgi:hypothetical protein